VTRDHEIGRAEHFDYARVDTGPVSDADEIAQRIGIEPLARQRQRRFTVALEPCPRLRPPLFRPRPTGKAVGMSCEEASELIVQSAKWASRGRRIHGAGVEEGGHRPRRGRIGARLGSEQRAKLELEHTYAPILELVGSLAPDVPGDGSQAPVGTFGVPEKRRDGDAARRRG
jgi:hypothetical protein